jgi:hypothetical protein
MHIPADLIHKVRLPAGAVVVGADSDWPFYGEIATDGDWMVTELGFQGLTPGHDRQLYAVNIITGVSRHLADHQAGGSVANGRVAWVDPKCTYFAGDGEPETCTAWTLHLMDLATGSDRVVATGPITEGVGSTLWAYGDEWFHAGVEDVMPRAELSSDTLAYSTGDLKHGFTLHLLSISSGSERTLALGGMIQKMRWVGEDLVWVEATDWHVGGYSPDYSGTRLMLLRGGMGVAYQIGSNAASLRADSTSIVWQHFDGQFAIFRSSPPDWRPVVLGPIPSEADLDFTNDEPQISISDGWTGWSDTDSVEDGPAHWLAHLEAYVVLGPRDSEPRVVHDGCYLSGGWLFLVTRDKHAQPTGFEAVRLADLH